MAADCTPRNSARYLIVAAQWPRVKERLEKVLGQYRDRGEPRGSSPPTPPDMRVRIRRFGGLSYRTHSQSRNPERVEVSIGQRDMRAPGESASRHGPWALPAVCRGESVLTPRFRSSANRTVPRFHCFQIADRSLRRIHCSSPSSTDGVSHLPK